VWQSFIRDNLEAAARRHAGALQSADPGGFAGVLEAVAEFLESFFKHGELRLRPAGSPGNGPDTVPLPPPPVTGTHPERLFATLDGRQIYIHTNLGGMLTEALDRFLADRLMRAALDQPGGLQPERVPAVRGLAGELIRVLADREDALAGLYAAPSRIIKSGCCLTLDRLPGDLADEVLTCTAQRREWLADHPDLVFPGPVDTGRDPAGPGVRNQDSRPDDAGSDHDRSNNTSADPSRITGAEFIRRHPVLVVDTRHFPDAFRRRLKRRLAETGRAPDGVLYRGDNGQVLPHLINSTKNRIRCIYIDPPFNTGNRDFLYPDTFTSEAWLVMMNHRLMQSCDLLTEDGSLYVHIDGNEKERLRLLLDRHLTVISEIIWRIGWISGFKTKAKKYIRNHDTIYYCGKTAKPLFNRILIPHDKSYKRRGPAKPAKKTGYPLEDTWNCSPHDPLHSIQILSFSKEKIGKGLLTQKNESLLERIINTSSNTGDTVLDYFSGSGTSCAAAHKMGRKWIGVDTGDVFDRYLLPRMKTVLAGDRFGISKRYKWHGGGCFEFYEMEPFEDLIVREYR
jgi:DNA methylase